MKLVSISYSQLNLTWSPPKNPNGIIIGYKVTWRMVSNDKLMSVFGNLNISNRSPEARSYLIEYLGKYKGTVKMT